MSAPVLKHTSLKLPPGLFKLVKIYSAQNDKTVQRVLAEALSSYLEARCVDVERAVMGGVGGGQISSSTDGVAIAR